VRKNKVIATARDPEQLKRILGVEQQIQARTPDLKTLQNLLNHLTKKWRRGSQRD
jgi:short-subunit dehydrogenase involved in D-alanine esterification of teichoic acids